jgi:hypothetical protein
VDRPAEVVARPGQHVDLLGAVGADVADPQPAGGVDGAAPRRAQAVGVHVRVVVEHAEERVVRRRLVPAAVSIARRQDADHRAEVVVQILAVVGLHLVAEKSPHGAGRVEADRADVVPRAVRRRVAGAQDLDRRRRDGGVVVRVECEPHDRALGHGGAGTGVEVSVVGEVRIERERDEAAVQARIDTGHLEVAEPLGAIAAQAEMGDAAVLAGHEELVSAGQESQIGGQVEPALDVDRLEVERRGRRSGVGSARARPARGHGEGEREVAHESLHGSSSSITRRSLAMAAVSRRSTPSGGMSRSSGSSCSPETAR